MAFYLGSFTGGLFSGAQSAMSLYSAYQGIMNQQAWSDAADEVKQARQTQAGYNQADTAIGELAAQRGQAAQPPADQSTQPAQPAQPSDKPPEKPAVDVPKITALTGATIPGFSPAQTDQAIRARQALAASPGTGVQISSGVGAPVAPPPVQVQPPAQTPPAQTPSNFASDTGLPMPQPNPPVTSQPGVSRPPAGALPGWTAPALPSYPAEQPVPPRSQALTAPPPSVTEPVGGYLTGRNTPGAIPATTVAPVFPPPQTPQPQAQVPQPVSPPGQDEALAKAKATGQSVPFGNQGMFVNPDGTVGAPPAAPIGGTARGTPVASAAPTSLGGRILGALNPVSSAQAAENPPEQQLAVAQAQAKDSNAPVKMADGRTVNPNGTVDNPPAQGVTTAQPPKGATPPTQAGPVKVSGATGEVVPGQKGPSTQSESTPPVLGPSVSPGAYLRMATANPAMKQLVDDVVAAHGGGGAVSVYDVAAVAERESGWKVDAQAHGAMGAGQGLMQIEPDTQAGLLKALPGLEASLGHRFDPFNAKDNLIMGTEYLKYLALTKGYGSGTVQMHLAYMRGDGAERGVARLQQVGWEQYAKEQPIAAKGLMRLYDDKLKIDTSMFPGGGTYDARQLVNATHQSGPDATLHMLATTGPAGLGMTDRWRSAQAALEYAAIRSGHMDMLPQINDWISQTSHQGAVSNLMAADQALLSGNMQGASDALAKAHAFFPDGTYARIGATDDGRLWATQLSERDGKPMGKPFQVTHEMLASQIIAMQNPSNYVQALQKFQLTNAQIELAHAHAGYYQDLPEQRREAAALRAQTQEDATEQRRQAAQQHNETMLEQQRMRGEQAAGNTAAAERPVDAHIAKDYGADGTPPPVDVNGQPMSSSRYAAMGEVQRAFQYPSKSGGGAISAPLARDYAEKFMKGQWHLAPSKERDASGNPTGYGLVDEKGNPHGYLSTDMGNRILNLQGTERVQTGTGRQAAIGAGAGSYAALQSGYNQNLSNQPTQALTQAA